MNNVTVLAVEAIKRGQAALDYYIKEQGWDEAYARKHVEIVFSASRSDNPDLPPPHIMKGT